MPHVLKVSCDLHFVTNSRELVIKYTLVPIVPISHQFSYAGEPSPHPSNSR